MSRLPILRRHPTRPLLRILREDVREEGDPVILPFLSSRSAAPSSRHCAPRFSQSDLAAGENRMDPLTRARVLHDNRRCPNCHRGGVIPLDLGDGDDRYGTMPVPGTATLVGFSCPACGAEWSL
jgi:hypothetical protein